jgi:hypothetical protein
LSTLPDLKTRFARHRMAFVACGAAIAALSVATHALHRYTMFTTGNTVAAASSALAFNEELAGVTWLRQHASSDDLVLSPPASAGWIATVPIHSFAGHWLFSFDYATQVRLADAFYAGRMGADEAGSFLAAYGIKYVLTPPTSPVRKVLDDQSRVATAGTWSIYAYPRNHMQPYSERAISGLWHFWPPPRISFHTKVK